MPGGVAPRPSTRLLLKRREVAEVERALQRRREVRADPGPSVCPLPGCCTPGTARAVHGMLPSPMFLQEVWQRMEHFSCQITPKAEISDIFLKLFGKRKVVGHSGVHTTCIFDVKQKKQPNLFFFVLQPFRSHASFIKACA